MPRKQPSAAERRLETLDEVISALDHASRRQILLAVRFRGGEMTAGDIASRFDCAWPTISRHLSVLERSGLIVHEKRGRTRLYRIDETKLAVVKEWLDWFEGDEGGAKSQQSKKV